MASAGVLGPVFIRRHWARLPEARNIVHAGVACEEGGLHPALEIVALQVSASCRAWTFGAVTGSKPCAAMRLMRALACEQLRCASPNQEVHRAATTSPAP